MLTNKNNLKQMETLQLFKKTIGPGLYLKLKSLGISLDHTEENGKHKIWLETEQRSSYIHFNPNTMQGSRHGYKWENVSDVITSKCFRQLFQQKL